MKGYSKMKIKDSQGSAFIFASFCLMVVTLAATSAMTLLQHSSNMNSRLVRRAQALAIAEGAANQILADIYLTPEKAYYSTGTKTTSLGGGDAELYVEHIQDEVFCVQSSGTFDNTTQTVKVYTEIPSFSIAFTRAIFSNQNIDANGNGTLDRGSHSNGKTSYSGNCYVDGLVDASKIAIIGGNAEVTGSVKSDVPRIEFPSLDFNYYYQLAQENNQIFVGDLSLKGTYSPPGGVLWIVGDVTINSQTVINGALFVTGDIRQTGSCEQRKVDNLPALVSRDGNIYLGGGGVFQGLIYAKSGRVDLYGTTSIVGQIIAWDDVYTRGNWGVIIYEEQQPEVLDDNLLTVLAWER